MNFEKFSKNALWFFTVLSLLATALVSRDLLFPFITTKAFFFRVCLELAMPFYVYLVLSRKNYRPSLKNPVNLLLLAFLLINVVSSLIGVNVTKSLWGNFERMGGAYYLAHLALLYFYVVLLGQIGGRYMQNFLKALLAVSALITLNGISGMLGGPILVMDPSLPTRASSTLGNPIFFASFLIIPLFVSVFFVSQSQSKSEKFFYGFLALLQLVGIFQSGTRGAVVGLALGVFVSAVVYVVLSPVKKVRIYGSMAVAVFAAIVILLFTFHEKLPEGTTLRRVFNLRDSNTNSRLIQWRIAFTGIKDYPIFGTGPENYYLVGNKYYDNELYKYDRSWFDKPHNFLLEILVTTGILGFAAYFGILVSIVWILWRAYRKELLTLFEFCGFLAATLAYQIQNIFVFDTIPASLMFYAFLGFVGFLHFENNLGQAKVPKILAGSQNYVLPQGFTFSASALGLVMAIYLVVVTNYFPARASKNVNYGYAYASIDPKVAANHFKTATSLPFIFDFAEIGAKFTDFATSLVRSPLAKSAPKFVDEQLKAAMDFQLKTLEKAPNDPIVLQKLSSLYLFNSVFYKTPISPEAFEYAQDAINLAPKRTEARLMLAQLRLYQGYAGEAVKLVEEAINLDPTNMDTKWQLALVYHDAGQEENSVKLAEKLLSEGYKPNEQIDLTWLVSFYVKQNNQEKSISLAKKNLELRPKNLNAAALLYKVFLNFGQKEQGEQLLEAFKKFQPARWAELEKLINPPPQPAL